MVFRGVPPKFAPGFSYEVQPGIHYDISPGLLLDIEVPFMIITIVAFVIITWSFFRDSFRTPPAISSKIPLGAPVIGIPELVLPIFQKLPPRFLQTFL